MSCRHQLFGGIRGPYFIDLSNPIRSRKEKQEREAPSKGHHATKKTPAQRDREIKARALKEQRARLARERDARLDAALATTLETRRADPYNIASWETQPKRHHATKTPPAQLQREIDEILAPKSGSYEHPRTAKGFVETAADRVARINGWSYAYANGWLDGQTQAKHGQRRDQSRQGATDDYARGYSRGYSDYEKEHGRSASSKLSHAAKKKVLANPDAKVLMALGTLAHNRRFTTGELSEHLGRDARALVRSLARQGFVELVEGKWFPTSTGWKLIEAASD